MDRASARQQLGAPSRSRLVQHIDEAVNRPLLACCTERHLDDMVADGSKGPHVFLNDLLILKRPDRAVNGHEYRSASSQKGNVVEIARVFLSTSLARRGMRRRWDSPDS